MILKEKLRSYCFDLGFNLVGFISPLSIKEEPSCFKSNSASIPFANSDISLRTDAERIFPGVKSILVLGIGYGFKKEKKEYKPLKAKPARYAMVEDYHRVIRKKMDEIIEFLKKENIEFEYKMFVDSSPLSERFLAVKTGQGWIGQNTCFYTKDTGSWIFLSEILLTIPFEQDEAVFNESKCLDCMECIKACPTDALIGNHTLDAGRCLAYLTQSKKIIPQQHISLIKDVIVGCDICQEVCPNNQEDKIKEQNVFKPLEYLEEFDLLKILELSNKDFKERYGKAAFAWLGKNVLVKNAIIALGNQHAKEANERLKEFLEHPNEQIRYYANWALKKMNKN